MENRRLLIDLGFDPVPAESSSQVEVPHANQEHGYGGRNQEHGSGGNGNANGWEASAGMDLLLQAVDIRDRERDEQLQQAYDEIDTMSRVSPHSAGSSKSMVARAKTAKVAVELAKKRLFLEQNRQQRNEARRQREAAENLKRIKEDLELKEYEAELWQSAMEGEDFKASSSSTSRGVAGRAKRDINLPESGKCNAVQGNEAFQELVGIDDGQNRSQLPRQAADMVKESNPRGQYSQQSRGIPHGGQGPTVQKAAAMLKEPVVQSSAQLQSRNLHQDHRLLEGVIRKDMAERPGRGRIQQEGSVGQNYSESFMDNIGLHSGWSAGSGPQENLLQHATWHERDYDQYQTPHRARVWKPYQPASSQYQQPYEIPTVNTAQRSTAQVQGSQTVQDVYGPTAYTSSQHGAPGEGQVCYAGGPGCEARTGGSGTQNLGVDADTSSMAVARTLEKITSQSELPAPPPMKFDGSSADFPKFLKNFQDRVSSKPFSDSYKLSQLIMCLSGEAGKAIKRYEGTENGYTLAMEVLTERFGRPYQIVKSCIDKLTLGPNIAISNRPALLEFADLLDSTYHSLQDQDLLDEANTQSTLTSIFNRLPVVWQTKWVQLVLDFERRGRLPKLKDMVAFVNERSKTVNHAIYKIAGAGASGGSSYQGKPTSSTNFKGKAKPSGAGSEALKKVTTLSTQVQEGNGKPANKKCSYCDQGHGILDCKEFKSKSIQFRKRFVRNNGLCFCCCGRHMVKNCRQRKTCTVRGCERLHHPLLHSEEQKEAESTVSRNQQQKTESPKATETASKVQVGSVITSKPQKAVLLKVIPVCVKAENGNCLTTFAMLDSGSSATMVTEAVARKLGMRGETQTVSISTVLAQGQDREVKVTSFSLTPVGRSEPEIPVTRAHVVESLHVDRSYKPDSLDLKDWEHLNELDLRASVEVDEVSLLIGENVPFAHAVIESIYGKNPHSEPYAVKTPLAWCVAGPAQTGHEQDSSELDVNLTIEVPRSRNGMEVELHESTGESKDKEVDILKEAVCKLWEEEKHGFTCDGCKGLSVEDKRALALLEESAVLKDGKYRIGMLWRAEDIKLPNNKIVAEKRLMSLGRRFKQDPTFAAMYRKSMDDYITKGYAAKMSEEDAAKLTSKSWYLPHHGVLNPNKPGKVRVVYDAAASYGGTSLNNELLQGPDFNNSLLGVLLRFRQGQIALLADVEAMFLQFGVPEADSEALRFLWWTQDTDTAADTYRMTRHIFGARDSPSVCTYGLQRCARDHESSFDAETVHTVMRNFYVDDLLKSITPKLTAAEATRLALQLIQLLQRGGLKLRSFTSNSQEVLLSIPDEYRAASCKDVELGSSLPKERALGIIWDVEEDSIGIKVSEMSQPDTKRGCLAAVSSLYDPLGLVSPVTLHAKKILQAATKADIGWDEELPELLRSQWIKWKNGLSQLENVKIPRWYLLAERPVESLELHHFADASESGYGTVSYLRKVFADGSGECSFVMAKGRTAPSNFLSVPRLELQAAVVASRVDRVIRQELELSLDRVIFWTDSRICLQYIRNETRRFKTYVANRVTEIRDASTPGQWRHVPGKDNPADDVSRGQSVTAFLNNERWFGGPAYLRGPEHTWPSAQIETLAEDDPELKQEQIVGMITEVKPSGLDRMLERSSTLTTLQRRTAVLLKFCEYLKIKTEAGDQGLKNFKREISVADMEKATQSLVRYVQKKAFAAEIADLQQDKPVKGSSKLKQLNPVLIDGILRVGGRLTKAPVAFDSKFPMLIPSDHHLADVIILHFHRTLAHCGQEQVLAASRERFWIPKARSKVRRLLHDCLGCRKLHARRIEQVMADLPKMRLQAYEPPFTRTGVDYFGPLYVKKGRSTLKRWGSLFTCLNTRAVHIEIAESMDTSSFINALRRFCGRRGDPKDVWSDNGSNFHGGEREMKEALEEWNQGQIAEELRQRGIAWHFQPPAAPHMSGIWERMVKSVKLALRSILGNNLVSEEVLSTAMVEVERILNSRPLCKVSDDPRDDEVLSPSHFLLQKGCLHLPPGLFVDTDKFHRKQWRHAQLLADHFWKRWVREYLATLQERSKWQRKHRNVTEGDVVLLSENDMPRGQWPLGVVTRVFPGDDGCTRVVELKTRNTHLIRPVHKLCLLESSSTN